jgi:predicted AAA+ superfamily ATPase
MVFIGGPRQVGKTTLAKALTADANRSCYLSWDSRPHRRQILEQSWPSDTDFLIFDEIHKYPKWKGLIKGVWDTRLHNESVLVTGSSRLDIYRRGGDSLQGRYHYYRLHPFSLREYAGRLTAPDFPQAPPQLAFGEAIEGVAELLRWGGFPEPLLAQSERTHKRWQHERFERVFREDIRDLEPVRHLAQVELLADLLPARVGAPLSCQSLSEDLEASPKSIRSWVELLCRNYFLFRVPPYHRRVERALRKECKYYLWDWSAVAGPGPRFENLVASHLLKYCHFHQDAFGLKVELHYLRDQQKREVDFLLTWEGDPWLLIEAKLSGGETGPLRYFGDRLGVASRFLVSQESAGESYDRASGVRVLPAARFLGALV